MPEQKTIKRARKKKKEGKSLSTQAGEFVREEIEHIRKGLHGAKSAKQALAIGLSKARRAGVKLRPYKGKKNAKTSRASASPPSRHRGAALKAARTRSEHRAHP